MYFSSDQASDRDYVAALDANESPIGPPGKAIRRLVGSLAFLHRYPHDLRAQVTAAVAEHYDVDLAGVLMTCGVDEATDLVLSVSASAWYVTPGFDGYGDRARVLGRRMQPIALTEHWQPVLNPVLLTAEDAVFLAYPSNPTGNAFSRQWMERVLASPALVMVDETYLEFGTARSFVTEIPERPRMVVFKSFSKVFGLAGLRVGVLLGPPALIGELAARQPYQSVDSVGLSAALGALEDHQFEQSIVDYVRSGRVRFLQVLERSSLFVETRDTQTNFVLARCRSESAAVEVADRLAQLAVRVKNCAPLGLPGWLRVSIGAPCDLQMLSRALDAIDPCFQTVREEVALHV